MAWSWILNAALHEINNLQGFPGKIIQPGSCHPKGNMPTLCESVWGLGGERVLFLQELYSHPSARIMSGSQGVSSASEILHIKLPI